MPRLNPNPKPTLQSLQGRAQLSIALLSGSLFGLLLTTVGLLAIYVYSADRPSPLGMTPHQWRVVLGTLFGIMLCSSIGAFGALYMGRRMLGGLLAPLRDMASVAHAARRERSLERRVADVEVAEINDLVHDFNGLLDELEAFQNQMFSEAPGHAHPSSQDSLTGLPNQAFFQGRLLRSLRNAVRERERLAVLVIDGDGFDEINREHGYPVGNDVLVQMANRLSDLLRDGDLVARLDGDVFGVLLAPLHRTEDAERIASKILDVLSEPIRLPDASSLTVSVSVGIAQYPEHARDAGELLDAAYEAMRQSKGLGRGGWRRILMP